MDNNERDEFESYSMIPKIRKGYQIFFYASIVFYIFALILLVDAGAEFYTFVILVIAFLSSYAVLIVLRALENLIRRFFYLEQTLAKKGVITVRANQERKKDE
jgi:hypothetical protein